MPDQVQSQRTVYDEHYPQMAAAVRDQLKHPLLSSFYDRLAGLILDALPAAGTEGPRRLLEAGCGEGLLASAFRRVAGLRDIDLAYTGTDLSTAGIELARSGVEETFVAGDAVEILAGTEAGSQDLVAAKNLLHHI